MTALLLPTLVTAVALSMDAVAVSIAAGLAHGKASLRDAAKVALCFGGFQAAMPIGGALLGSAIRSFVSTYAPVVAGLVLVGLGLFAVREALSDADEEEETRDFFELRVLLVLGVATSLDAFAVGVSFSLVGAPLLPSAALIGLVTFTLSLLAVLLADRVERVFGSKSELAGGIALVGLGLKFLLEPWLG
ncbi:MAG: manganese efflux pump MntP family protein [Polyangiales bacterium]